MYDKKLTIEILSQIYQASQTIDKIIRELS